MPFIVEDEITIVGMFWQNGFQTIQIGIPVDIVFDNAPDRVYVTAAELISTRQRQIAALFLAYWMPSHPLTVLARAS